MRSFTAIGSPFLALAFPGTPRAITSLLLLLVGSHLSLPSGSAAQVQVEIGEAIQVTGRIMVMQEEDEELAQQPEQDDEDDSLLADGPITEASESMQKLISLEWEEGLLRPDVLDDRRELQQTIYSIRSAAGGGGMSSSSSGDNSWWYQFQGSRLVGTFQNNWPRNSGPDKLMFQLVELQAPYREFTLEREADDGLSIMLAGGVDPFILRVRQGSNGEFIVQEVDGTNIRSFREASFGAFCRKHVEYSQRRLLPLLRELGITPPATPQDLKVQASVIKRLAPLDPVRVEEFKQRIAEFDADSFEKREAATEAFADDFENYRDIVTRAIDDEQYSAEARTRLLGLLKENSEEGDIRTRAVISRLELDEDPSYLVWLLEQQDDTETQQIITARLQSLTGLKLAADAAAWRSELDLATTPELDEEPQPDIDMRLLSGSGQLTNMRNETAKLVKLNLNEERLRLDREHWAQPFGGKTLSTLTEEINAELEKRGFPSSFFTGIDEKRYPMLGYPHVIFESFYQELQKHPQQGVYRNRNNGGHHSPNRSFSLNGMECSLATQPGGNGRIVGQADNDSKLFRLRLSEVNSPQRTLAVEENEEQRFRLEFTCDDADVIIRLMELPEQQGWVLQDLRGTEVFAKQAKSYPELYAAHQAYFDETFFPLMAQLGVIPPGKDELPDAEMSADKVSADKEEE